MGAGGAPQADLRRVRDAHLRFLEAITGAADADVRETSRLPGWTVGHVLAHVARNADSHVRRTEAAMRGEVVEQYPGGFAGRSDEIERGAHRTAEELRADVAASAKALDALWSSARDEVWDEPTRDVVGRERPLRQLPSRRWQELEVHVVDLGLGVSHRDWSDDFVAAWLPRLRSGMTARLASGAAAPGPDALDTRDELAWLYGRLTRPGLPTLVPWA